MRKLGPSRVALRVGALCFAAGALLLLAASTAGASLASPRYATIRWSFRRASGKVPHRLLVAAYGARRADTRFVSATWRVRRCRRSHPRHPRRHCKAQNARLQRSGRHLRRAEARLAKVSGGGSEKNQQSGGSGRRAPQLTVSGDTISWPQIDSIEYYVLATTVPGRETAYSLVHGESVTPPPVAGTTVRYTVRTSTSDSQWAPEVSITYPAAPPPPSGGSPAPDPQEAPKIAVEGNRLSWNQVASVNTYVFLTRVAGRPDVYSEVEGTSFTPAPIPGATVIYSVRTAVEGSAWAKEVSIAYPASQPAPKEETPSPGPTEAPSGSTHMDVALDIGGWDWESAIRDESGAAKYVRSSYRHWSTDAQMAMLANAGVTLMPLFGEGGTLAEYDSPTFVAEIVNWFKRYGRGGTFWAGRSVDLGATTAELLNEPGNPNFYADYTNIALYATLTKAVHAALEANFAPAVRPKLLVSYDGGYNGSEYGRALFADGAVADGVTVHPYGGHGSVSALGNRERVTQAHSGTGRPVYVTEVGWPTAVGQPATPDSLQWSEQQQAENLTSFMNWARGLGYVADVTYFNYADYGTNYWYGIVNTTGTRHKLSYEALRAESAIG